MSTQTKRTRPKRRPIQHPKGNSTRPPRRWWVYALAVGGLLALATVLALTLLRGGVSGEKASAGLPNTADYHSLLVSQSDPQKLLLGTHNGLYVSSDGGRRWRFEALSGDDAMNLARPGGQTVWLAGHMVFKKSSDGGVTWSDVRPVGLPSLDIHGFAVDPRNPNTLYAAVAGEGLFRSADGGRSFSLASEEIGGQVMALAVLPNGRILAGDMSRGLLTSGDRGASWKPTLRAQVIGLAINPSDAKRLLATGRGIALSTDGGRTWRSALELPDGAGPVAWSKSDPKLAYAIGFDRVLYRSTDAGESWQPVEES
jgi:photosystem II stability/assembly factor-like uncharacterized protein